MNTTAPRWLQKFASYKKALSRLYEALNEHQRQPTDFIPPIE